MRPTAWICGMAAFVAATAADAEAWWRPGLVASWQVQYSGDLRLDLPVQVMNLDLFDTDSVTIGTAVCRQANAMNFNTIFKRVELTAHRTACR